MKNLMMASLVAGALVACGGGGDGSSSTASTQTVAQPLLGLYSGTIVSSANGTRTGIFGAALTTGEVAFYAPTECHTFFGTQSSSGSGATSVTATGIAKDSCYGGEQAYRSGWPTGGAYPVYTTVVNASGSTRSDGSASLNYSSSLGDFGLLELQPYPTLWVRDSSIGKIAGNYVNGALTAVIDQTGGFVATGRPAYGTVKDRITYTGQLAVIDPTRNLYRLTMTHPTWGQMSGFAHTYDSKTGTKDDGIAMFARGGSNTFVYFMVRP